MHKWAKWGAIVLLALGGVLAVMALWLSVRARSSSDAVTVSQDAAPMRYAVEVVREIPAGTVLLPADVRLRSVQDLPAGSYTETHVVIGRSVQQPLPAGTLLLGEHLQSGISGLLQLGERAVSIKVDEASAVGHRLKPGDWVDVFVVLRKDGQEVNTTLARQLLARKRLLAYGDAQDHKADPAAVVQAEKNPVDMSVDRSQKPARTAVLAVALEEVNALLLAEQQGVVLLALRNPADDALSQEWLQAGERLAASKGMTLAQVAQAADSATEVAALRSLEGRPEAKLPAALTAPPSASMTLGRLQRGGEVRSQAVEFIKGTRKEWVHY